ncbi:MAG: hypothetical protein GC165_08665 [Armatimonadetes bacterium]|nr:hypothetical protein [Armatimonadota bacterium]
MGIWAMMATAAVLQQPEQKVVDQDIDAVVRRLAKDPLEIETLSTIAWKNMPRVIYDYRHANGSVRSRILAAVHRSPGSYSDLLPLAAKEKAEDLRVMAATILGQIIVGRGPNKRNPLLISMRSDRSPLVRAVVAKALRWGVPNARPLLVSMVKDPQKMVRLQAGLSLGYLHAPEALPALAPFLGDWTRGPVPIEIGGDDHVVQAMSRFGAKAIPFVEPKLKSHSSQTLIDVSSVLVGVDAPKLLEDGLILAKNSDPMVRIQGYRMVAWQRKPEAIPILLKGLEDKGHNKENNIIVWQNVKSFMAGDFHPRDELGPWKEGIAAYDEWSKSHPNQ